MAGAILYFWSHRERQQLTAQHWKSLAIIAVLFFVFGHGLLAWAQKRVASGLAAVLIASDPLWIAAIEFFTVKTFRLKPFQTLGLLIGFGGIILLFLPTGSGSSKQMDTIGAGVILLSAVCWSIGAVYSRVANLPQSAKLSAGIELIIGGIFLIVTAVFLGELKGFSLMSVSVRSYVAFFYLVIFGSVVTFTAYVWLLQETSATRVATHTYVNPVIAVLLGSLFAGESFTLPMLIASAVIVASVYAVLRR